MPKAESLLYCSHLTPHASISSPLIAVHRAAKRAAAERAATARAAAAGSGGGFGHLRPSAHNIQGRKTYTSYLQRPQYQRRNMMSNPGPGINNAQHLGQHQQHQHQHQRYAEENRAVTFDSSTSTSTSTSASTATTEALAAARAIGLCEEVLKTPAKPRRMSLRR